MRSPQGGTAGLASCSQYMPTSAAGPMMLPCAKVHRYVWQWYWVGGTGWGGDEGEGGRVWGSDVVGARKKKRAKARLFGKPSVALNDQTQVCGIPLATISLQSAPSV